MGNLVPRVSIGLPVFNGQRFLQETLDSFLAQTYKDFELIISDNASTDQTEAICQTYATKDRRIRYYRNQENLGMTRNYERVLKLSVGEYFKWASADDLCMPEFLARCVEMLDNDPSVVIACTKTLFIDETGNFLCKTDPGWHLPSESACERLRAVILVGGHWANADALSGLIRTKALLKTRPIPDYQGGDKRPLGELSLLGKFFEIPEYWLVRRKHSESSGSNTANVEWMARFFKGGALWRICLPTWSLCLDHFMTVMRSELSCGEKLSLAVEILRSMSWSRRRIAKEISVAARYLKMRVSYQQKVLRSHR